MPVVSVNSKRFQRSRTLVVPTQAAAAPAAPVEVDKPTYLEVPEFQRVAIIGDCASGVLFRITPWMTQSCNVQKRTFEMTIEYKL